MHRVLIVSLNQDLISKIRTLYDQGYRFSFDPGAEKSLTPSISQNRPEIVLLDHNSGVGTGTVRRVLAEIGLKDTYIILLIQKDNLDRFKPSSDPDDFIVMPLDIHELSARLKLFSWRLDKFGGEELIKIEGVVVDPSNYQVDIDGEPIELTYKEFELLKFLAQHRDRVFTRDNLLNQVWGFDYYGGTRTVDVHVQRIRSKLGPYGDLIDTIRNVGYRLKSSL